MDYHLIKIDIDSKWNEILMAFLGELPFDSFEETTTGFNAYIQNQFLDGEVTTQLEILKKSYPFEFSILKIENQNWNAVWEANFQPIQVGNFCGIRADFHPPFENMIHELVINPKMAFGTGHHETTFMMIQMMQELDFNQKYVFDYGCGTGVLAILASKLGASLIEAVDIEEPSFENTKDNARINQTENLNVYHGDLNAVHQTDFDIILANINRNVILNSLPALYSKLTSEGLLIISGVLLQDAELLKQSASKIGLTAKHYFSRGDWICIMFEK